MFQISMGETMRSLRNWGLQVDAPANTDFDTGFGSTIDYSTPNTAEGVTFDMQPAIDLLAAG